jgi:hypothetical protein
MNESESWIVDPRTPVKKFASLLFKLANIRHQVFKQIAKEFSDMTTIGGDTPLIMTPTKTGKSSFLTDESTGEIG